MKRVFDKFKHKWVWISDNDFNEIKTSYYWKRRYSNNEIKRLWIAEGKE